MIYDPVQEKTAGHNGMRFFAMGTNIRPNFATYVRECLKKNDHARANEELEKRATMTLLTWTVLYF